MRRSFRIAYFFAFFSIAFVAGCKTGPKSGDRGGGPMGPYEAYGPPVPVQQPAYGPEPVASRPVVLVFGPGLARGFAYAGVLRAFHDAKIPVGAILGTEMGGLIATLYAIDGNINHFEWALLKLKDDVFLEKENFISKLIKKPKDGKELESVLHQIFPDRDLRDSKITVRVALQETASPRPIVLGGGNTVQVLRAAMATPGFLTPGSWDQSDSTSAVASRPFMVVEGRDLQMGPVVAVDVLDSATSSTPIDSIMLSAAKASEAELKTADMVIHVDMKGIGYLDFSKRTQAAFRGKSAVRQRMSEIRRLIGQEQSS